MVIGLRAWVATHCSSFEVGGRTHWKIRVQNQRWPGILQGRRNQDQGKGSGPGHRSLGLRLDMAVPRKGIRLISH